jgi:hypothetical protein
MPTNESNRQVLNLCMSFTGIWAEMHSQDQFCHHPPLTVWAPGATASLWWIYPTISWQVLWIPGAPQNLALFRNCKMLRSFGLPIAVVWVMHFQYVFDWFYNTPKPQATEISGLTGRRAPRPWSQCLDMIIRITINHSTGSTALPISFRVSVSDNFFSGIQNLLANTCARLCYSRFNV